MPKYGHMKKLNYSAHEGSCDLIFSIPPSPLFWTMNTAINTRTSLQLYSINTLGFIRNPQIIAYFYCTITGNFKRHDWGYKNVAN